MTMAAEDIPLDIPLLLTLFSLLVLAAFVTAFVVVLVNRRRLRLATLPASLGLGVLTLGELGNLGWTMLSSNWYRWEIFEDLDLALFLSLIGFTLRLADFIGVAFLVVAILTGRTPAAAPSAPVPPNATGTSAARGTHP